MPPFDQLLDQATHRLRIDPELQREVRHELLTHLEDSAAEHRAAGVNEQEAAQQAIKDFGDPEVLSDQLFSANRRRIRFRQVAKWTMRAVLPPAAAVVAVSLAWGAVVYLAVLMVFIPGRSIPSPWASSIAEHQSEKMLSTLSSSQRLIFDQQTGLNNDGLQKAKALANRWPNEPLYQANYVIWIATQYAVIVNSKDEKGFRPTTAISLDDVLMAADHAESVEPENGFYNLMKAGALFHSSTEILEDVPEKDLPGFEDMTLQGKKVRYTFSPIRISNSSRFKQGLAEIHKAAAKPYMDSHVVDLLVYRLELLPTPARLNDRIMQLQYAISVLLPHLNYYRWIFRTIGAHIIHLAQNGKTERALNLIAEERIISAHMIAHSQVQVQLLVAAGLHGLVAQQEIMVNKIAGRHQAYEQALQQFHQEESFVHHLRRPPKDERERTLRLLQSADMADRMLIPSVADPAKLHVAPGRHAEYTVADQAALALFLALLLVAVVATEMRALLTYRNKNSRRLFVFVGWRRLSRVVLLGGLLPVFAYALYVWLVPADRHYNLLITHARLLVEYTILSAVIIMLLRRLGDAAVRQRAAELGLSIPKPSSRALDIVGLLLLLATIIYEFTWYIQAANLPANRRTMPWSVNIAGYVLAGLLLVYAVTWLVPVTLRQFCKNILSWAGIRSLIGRILLAVAAVLAMLLAMLKAPSNDATTYWLVIGIIAVILLVWLVWRAHGRMSHPSTAAPRPAGLLPIILALALILGLGGGGFLRWREARAVAQMPSVASRMLNEVADSRYQPLKERLTAMK